MGQKLSRQKRAAMNFRAEIEEEELGEWYNNLIEDENEYVRRMEDVSMDDIKGQNDKSQNNWSVNRQAKEILHAARLLLDD